MTDAEIGPFMDTFLRVARVFNLRGEADEVRVVGASYFTAMRRYPLGAVVVAAERCLEDLKRFPKPAEWIEKVPPRSAAAPLEPLTADEADDWLEAERRRWEGRPCDCQTCRQAGVQGRPLRFVPELDGDDRDVKARIGERVVTRGHWAHGAELARWYAAREECLTKWRKWGAKVMPGARGRKASFEDRLKAIYEPRRQAPAPVAVAAGDREPGEEG